MPQVLSNGSRVKIIDSTKKASMALNKEGTVIGYKSGWYKV